MMVADFIFFMFAAVVVVSALMVITVRNAVHSVLFLALTFFSTAGLFVLLQAEFLAAILVMVYMGAVAILFLFVVMMLDIDFTTLRKGAREHLPLGLTVGLVILLEVVAIGMGFHQSPESAAAAAALEPMNNTMELGKLLYTKYLFPFEVISLILLVALIGAVALTLRQRKDAKRQDIHQQLARKREDAVQLKKVSSGEGA
ncbi:MAG: NADH-quinone oxidoreductase subunit J [Magnetococcales bacterium]|nr:NADH-quinone oxidoreductase subunit J [Magnetococcales bacterium]